MGTYFNGNSEIQGGADGLQTLVLMNPGHFQYSGASTPPATGNFVFLNSAAYPINPSHAPPPQTQQFVGIPLAPHQDTSSQSMQAQAHHEIFAPRVQYNLWKPVDTSAAARESPRAQQGLSLSLFSQQHGQQAGFGSFGGEREMVPGKLQPLAVSGGSPASGVTNNGFSGMQSVLMSSKYLKAAQELLDEVVNVGNTGARPDPAKKSPKAAGESSADGSATAEASGKSSAELSTVEKQEIQMKKAKLINMLDEVEQRYRQYHHQMQIVTSSFEQVAGAGSARSYTALALKTISKQFRCLRDAITGQIRGASKSLGEEDCIGGGGKIGGSRLKFVDHQLRQQRALQQLGMSQQNAWRPQRGLPERAVSVLRAWLFEHFLHPYPKDSDKHMLAKQTGLTRSQVSNWFINARVRLWKPMVEEMYVEELKDQDQNGTEDKTLSKSDNINEDSPHDKSSGAGNMTNSNHDVPSLMAGNVQNQSVFTLTGSSELEGITQGSPKKPRGMDMVPRDEYSAMAGGPANFIGGFGQYPIGEIRRFDAEQYTPRFSGNGVSLTLGLPHGESLSTHQGFLPDPNMDQLGAAADEFGNVMSTSAPGYESIDVQRRKRFAAQLLPDFVA